MIENKCPFFVYSKCSATSINDCNVVNAAYKDSNEAGVQNINMLQTPKLAIKGPYIPMRVWLDKEGTWKQNAKSCPMSGEVYGRLAAIKFEKNKRNEFIRN